MPAQYVIGIDLGTTNTAVAYVDLNGAKVKGRRVIEAFDVPQLVAPGEVQGREGLPSFLYLLGGYDLPEGSTALPWDLERTHAVGELAREQGAKVPGRLVASAKSWLSHDGVDRTADLLPWGASKDVDQVSPVEASRRYLQHLREAWDHTMPAPFRDQIVILTVPASFDEVARELTVTAARRAGLDKVILLEEPLAAFYAWMSGDTRAQRAKMAAGDLVLVCDIGGGTTDFSLVALADAEDGGFRFDRLAVGDHLMLGGDNMDNALGRHVEIDLVGGPGKLDAQRWHQLVHRCRLAKERLLSTDDDDASEVVTVMGSGSSLIGGALSSTLNASDVERLLLDGFFPASSFADDPQRQSRAGLTEFGLPYESDPAITRHLSAFLRRYAPLVREHTGRDAVPTHILFNGGVMASPILRERIRRTVGQWYGVQQG
ncbi:MAG: Hsp70 family protein, partial [Bacteroidota bacterium]